MEFYMLTYGDLYCWWHISQSVPSLLLRLFFPLKSLPCSAFPLRFYFTFQLKKQSCILVNHETSVSNVHCPLLSNHSACMNSYKFPTFSYFSYLSLFFSQWLINIILLRACVNLAVVIFTMFHSSYHNTASGPSLIITNENTSISSRSILVSHSLANLQLSIVWFILWLFIWLCTYFQGFKLLFCYIFFCCLNLILHYILLN